MRIGHGYDAHRFAEGRELILGGVHIEHNRGMLAHSDGDVLVHALMDALLGAAGERDIGYNFPCTDEFKDADSCVLLEKTMEIIRGKGLEVDYCDMTVIAEEPRMKNSIIPIRRRLSEVMGVPVDRINVKATTEEGMGFTGAREGIAAHAVCILREQ